MTRGDTQFPELSEGEAGAEVLLQLLAVAAAPAPSLAFSPAPPSEGAAREGLGEDGAPTFPAAQVVSEREERLICNWGRAD